MLKRSVLAIIAAFAISSAEAATITVTDTSSFGTQVLAQNEIFGYGPIFFLGNTSGGVVSAFQSGNSFELAANNVSNTLGDTLNIYALWQGLTTPTGLVTITTNMATDEFAFPGWTLSELVYVNGQAIVSNTQFGLGGPPTETFNVSLGVPFDLQLQLQFVSNGAPPYGDFGSYVIASLSTQPPHPVPGPIVGAGLPGLLAAIGLFVLGHRRRRA